MHVRHNTISVTELKHIHIEIVGCSYELTVPINRYKLYTVYSNKLANSTENLFLV